MPKTKRTSQILEKRARKNQRGYFPKIFKWFFLISFIVILIGSIGIAGVYLYLSKNLPKISSLKDYRPPIITTVYSDDNRKIAEFFKERRIVLPLSKMPEMLKKAFVAAEDARFYKHKGIDVLSIFRAFYKNIEAGAIVQGGSTITQQVTKSFLLTPERSYTRKIKEAILAYRIDKKFAKDEILFLYLNQIYLGHGAYGVEAASENYFGKSAYELNLAECAILAGLPQAPSRYSPFKYPERAKQRQIYVLNRMVEEGFITNIQATEAINKVLDIKPRRNLYIEEVPVYTEHIRRYIAKKYGDDVLYKEGLKIYSAVNIEMQKMAREEIGKGLYALDKREGYQGPIKHLKPEEIESFSKELQLELEEAPLEEAKIVKGVVIEINDKNNTVIVRMGSTLGVIRIDDMRWARKPNPEIAYY
ncbi:MAG TPA: transglycosylase domain-containing protein, partial [Desulfobacterales bacterium]|nr:transglycosylase domain-containing protein [Desulfobacterales bacterium]